MTHPISLPQPGPLLRTLINAGGYRPCLAKSGRDKDLDDLAAGKRLPMDLLHGIEAACVKELEEDCGPVWAHFFQQSWHQTFQTVQTLAQRVDTCFLTQEQVNALVLEHATIPMVAQFMQSAAQSLPGPDMARWWDRPLQAWLAWTALCLQMQGKDLQDRLANVLDADQRTLERWLAGEPMGKLAWPHYAGMVEELTPDEPTRHLLAGWLLLARACQSLPATTRTAIRDMLQRKQPWAPIHAVNALRDANYRQGAAAPLHDETLALMDEIEALFNASPPAEAALAGRLAQFQSLLAQTPAALRGGYPSIHAWFSARHAALREGRDEALRMYEDAVSLAWWRTGSVQHPILHEALVHAVGVGDKHAADRYWDKTFILGLNEGSKRPLDTQELRRLGFAFEHDFHPRKAKDRIPPSMEFHGPEDAFSLKPEHMKTPNQKIAIKQAQGRTRRTPLMQAVMEGTLDEVQQLIAAGGNPDNCIPETGEGPLSYAMRRASDRKDPAIMEYLLGLGLDKEAVNRPAGTARETPLKLAVEMADARVVQQLLKLGADVEKPCDHLPSALCYAMQCLHNSLHRGTVRAQMNAYAHGHGPADVHDAKKGAALDIELADRRQHLAALRDASPRNQQSFDAVLNYYIRPPQDCRAVVLALLEGGADANRRYHAQPNNPDAWTPTLFAAQTGDLPTFQALLAHGGDPHLTLHPTRSPLERLDALWVASAHQRSAILDWLTAHPASPARPARRR